MSQSFVEIFEPISNPSILRGSTKPQLQSVVLLGNQSIVLTLVEGYLFAGSLRSPEPTHCLPLVFETKFQILLPSLEQCPDKAPSPIPSKLILEKEGFSSKCIFTSEDSLLIQQWGLFLERQINQRNFHQLFKAKKKIGRGAFATVYLAQRLRDGLMVAVKAFSKEKQYSGDKGKESLQNEIQLMRKMHHENIMRLYGVYETQNSIYVILEHMEGMQLNEFLKSGKKLLDWEAKEIIKNIVRGLQYLAAHRVIHRDLKPENIMLKKNDSLDLALCDLGLATHAEDSEYLFVRCGTPGFVAPEIINIKDMNQKSDPISDIFSAGIIFHHLLTGHSIFPGKKYNQILYQNRSCNFNFDKEEYHQMNSKALHLLKRMLEVDPKTRITADEILRSEYFTDFMEAEDTEVKVERKNFKQAITRSKNTMQVQFSSKTTRKSNLRYPENGA